VARRDLVVVRACLTNNIELNGLPLNAVPTLPLDACIRRARAKRTVNGVDIVVSRPPRRADLPLLGWTPVIQELVRQGVLIDFLAIVLRDFQHTDLHKLAHVIGKLWMHCRHTDHKDVWCAGRCGASRRDRRWRRSRIRRSRCSWRRLAGL